MEAVKHQRELRLSISSDDPRVWFLKGSHEKLKWGNQYVHLKIFLRYILDIQSCSFGKIPTVFHCSSFLF